MAEFFAEVIGVDAEVVGLAITLRAPDFAEDLALGDDFPLVAGE